MLCDLTRNISLNSFDENMMWNDIQLFGLRFLSGFESFVDTFYEPTGTYWTRHSPGENTYTQYPIIRNGHQRTEEGALNLPLYRWHEPGRLLYL